MIRKCGQWSVHEKFPNPRSKIRQQLRKKRRASTDGLCHLAHAEPTHGRRPDLLARAPDRSHRASALRISQRRNPLFPTGLLATLLENETMKTIIAAVDFSDATPAVVKMTSDLARRFHAHVLLFHVIEPMPGAYTYGLSPDEYHMMAEILEESRRRSSELLEKMIVTVKLTVPAVSYKIGYGSPLQALLTRVSDYGADLVVVGAHGHGAVGALVLGSVPSALIRQSSIPTLVVPATYRPEIAQEEYSRRPDAVAY
ncbi:MAG: universal stress protein [Verrucomicrobiaceae bacterium]|nr:MAG: universal stress protein [Verrucomicrobiaceae bacterium]